MIGKSLNAQQLRAICGPLADTNNALTKNELTYLLNQCQIELVNDGISGDGLTYRIGLSKRDWLYKCFINEINSHQSYEKIYVFIEKALDPVNYTSELSRAKYNFLFEEINKVLLLIGLSVTKEGRLTEDVRATTLDEVDRRVNSLRVHLYQRAIHPEVSKYCIKDYLRKDYYDTVFEASKGLAERVRQISGLTTDGSALFQKAFGKSDPYVYFNTLTTESEINEFNGLKELLDSITHMVRNPAAHTPKVNWKMDETKALDILTVISFAHKYLDECNRMPGK